MGTKAHGFHSVAPRCVRTTQKPHPGHDPIAVADARSALDEVQLETPHLVGRRCIGRTLQPGGEPLAARNVAALSVRVELACSHVLAWEQLVAHRSAYTHRLRE